MIVQESFYENLLFADSKLPLIFHIDLITSESEFVMHWQDSPEILCFTEGRAEVVSEIQKEVCQAGDTAWINSGNLHSVRSLTENCRYYCLIVDRDFLDSQGILADRTVKLKISDGRLLEFVEEIARELKEQEACYEARVRALLMELGVYACRRYQDTPRQASPAESRRIRMVKEAIGFLQEHFTENLTVDEVSGAVGFSKYYFSRGFKEITGRTMVEYLNVIRTSHARRLLASGKYNVGESAERSGFTNLSYFTKIYKRYMGVLPSQEEALH